jgi:uncharacterized protein (TIGR03382 family)
MTIASATSSFPPIGQTAIAPAVEIQTFATTPVGHVESATVQIDATEASIGDPLLGNASDSAVATFTAIDPTTGLNALSQPFQATAFLAVHALPDQPGVLNEFASTSLASFMAPRLGVSVFDSRGHAVALLNPSTDLSNPTIVDPMIATMPTDPLTFINRAGALDDLVTTVLNSAEFVAGTGTYDDSFDPAQTLLQAREFLIQETATRGGGFVPTERIHYADATGVPSNPSSGLSHVRTGRDFEIALIETNLGPTGVIETGATDDFGIIVEVGQTRPGASVVPGEFVFLSFTGGLEGADIDSLDVPPHGGMTLLLYLDLDPLDSVLGAETITRLFVIDGSGSGEVDVLDVISLPEPGAAVSLPAGLLLLSLLSRRRRNG